MTSNSKTVNSAAIKAEIKRHDSLQTAINRLAKQFERVGDQQLRSGLKVYLHSIQGSNCDKECREGKKEEEEEEEEEGHGGDDCATRARKISLPLTPSSSSPAHREKDGREGMGMSRKKAGTLHRLRGAAGEAEGEKIEEGKAREEKQDRSAFRGAVTRLSVSTCAWRLMRSQDTGCPGDSERGVMAGRALARSCISPDFHPSSAGFCSRSPPALIGVLPVRLREPACLFAATLSEWMLLSTRM
ncbi:hypothetical protein ACER0C_023592 [Sarotherodon galilaeus]